MAPNHRRPAIVAPNAFTASGAPFHAALIRSRGLCAHAPPSSSRERPFLDSLGNDVCDRLAVIELQ